MVNIPKLDGFAGGFLFVGRVRRVMHFDDLSLKDAVTLGNLGAGFLALVAAAAGELWVAAALVCVGLVFDAFDGRFARRSGKDNDLGREIDSLADIVSFGAAPALIAAVRWGFSWPVVFFGLVFIFACCVRLARFNIQQEKNVFFGLPSPAAGLAAAVVAVISPDSTVTAAVLVALAALMVSGIRIPKR